jgi:hypothetical protein
MTPAGLNNVIDLFGAVPPEKGSPNPVPSQEEPFAEAPESKTPVIAIIGNSEAELRLMAALSQKGIVISVLHLGNKMISVVCEYPEAGSPDLLAALARPLVELVGGENRSIKCDLIEIETNRIFLEMRMTPKEAYVLDWRERRGGHYLPAVKEVVVHTRHGKLVLANSSYDALNFPRLCLEP